MKQQCLAIAVLLFLHGCGTKTPTKLAVPGETDEMGLSNSSDGFNLGSGSGTLSGLTGTEKGALTSENKELEKVAPASGPPEISPEVKDDLQKLQKLYMAAPTDDPEKNQEILILRYAIMGKLLTDCASKVAAYAPQPGETYLGRWAHRCTNSNINSGWELKGTYTQKDAAGIPLGKPDLSYKGVVFGDVNGTPVGGAGSGSFSADSSGNGESQGNWIATASGRTYPWTWQCSLKDQPSAATGNCVTKEQAQYCNSAPGALTQSTNPIPQKYDEGIKKLGVCYRRAMVLVSPILWRYMSKLNKESQNTLLTVLYLK